MSKKSKPLSEMDVPELRAEYANIMRRSEQTPAIFNAAVKAMIEAKGWDAEDVAFFVTAARRVSFHCGRCAGTGAYITGTVNGKPTGPGGECFRCGGKGRQTDKDRRRNYAYDVYAMGKAVQGMVA